MVALALSTPLAFARPLALALTPSGGAVPDDVFVAVRFGAAVLPVELEPALPFTGDTTAAGTRGARLLLLLGFPRLMLLLARLVLLPLARLLMLPLARSVPLPLARLVLPPLARLMPLPLARLLPLPRSRGKAAIDALPFLPAESAAFCAGTSSPIAAEEGVVDATAAPVAPATVGLPPMASVVEFAAGYTGFGRTSGDEPLACAGLPFAPLPPSLTVALFGSVRTLAIRCEAPRFASGACLRVADALSCIPATPAAAQLKTRTIATDRLPHIGPFE
jgi:hypothetical protein